MRVGRAAALLALVAAATRCELPERPKNTAGSPINECAGEGEESNTCGPEGVCLRGRCHARSAPDIPIYLEIARSHLSGADPAQSLLVALPSLAALQASDRLAERLDLGLPPLASFALTLLGPDPKKNGGATSARGCSFADQTASRALPVHATLLPSRAMRGLPLATIARSATDPNGVNPPLNLLVSALIPPASYDIYLLPTGDPSCPIPPILQLDNAITSDTVNILNAELSPTSRLSGVLTASPSLDLSGWSLQLTEERTGLRVSTLGSPVATATAGQWEIGTPYAKGLAPLEYYPPISRATPPQPGRLYLVMTPPAGVTAPKLAWDLASLDVFNTGKVSIDLTSLQLSQIGVELRVEQGDGPVGQPAQVWLRSGPQPGALSTTPPDLLASFVLGPLPTDADGVLPATPLVPGQYECVAVATGTAPLDFGKKTFSFLPPSPSPTKLAGFTLPISPRQQLDVAILTTTSDRPVASVPFELQPSLPPEPGVGDLLGGGQVPPRPQAGFTGADGRLLAATDSGTYDLTVRLPASSGFPWLLKPRLPLPLSSTGELRVSLPIEVGGFIYDLPLSSNQGSPLAQPRPLVGARLQAFALVGGSHVLIASSSVASDGSYRLLLPSRL